MFLVFHIAVYKKDLSSYILPLLQYHIALVLFFQLSVEFLPFLAQVVKLTCISSTLVKYNIQCQFK